LKSNRFWIIIFGAIILLSVIAVFIFARKQGDTVKIYQNGQLIHTGNLGMVSEPFNISVEFNGGTNIIAVEQGRIRVISANCFDGTCVRQGWHTGGLTPIVCLPNRLVITVEGKSDIDAVVG